MSNKEFSSTPVSEESRASKAFAEKVLLSDAKSTLSKIKKDVIDFDIYILQNKYNDACEMITVSYNLNNVYQQFSEYLLSHNLDPSDYYIGSIKLKSSDFYHLEEHNKNFVPYCVNKQCYRAFNAFSLQQYVSKEFAKVNALEDSGNVK